MPQPSDSNIVPKPQAIDKPDLAEREKIFMVHLKPVTLHKQLSAEEVAKRMASLTPGFAGAAWQCSVGINPKPYTLNPKP